MCFPPFGGKLQGGQACSAWKNKPDPVIWGNLRSTLGTPFLFLGLPCFSRLGKTQGLDTLLRPEIQLKKSFSPNSWEGLGNPKDWLSPKLSSWPSGRSKHLILVLWVQYQKRSKIPFWHKTIFWFLDTKSELSGLCFLFVSWYLLLYFSLVKTLLNHKSAFLGTSNILLCKFWVWGAWIRHLGEISPYSKKQPLF